MLQLCSTCSSETLTVEDGDQFRERINNAAAMSIVFAHYTKQITEPDDFELKLIAMVADGISDMLMTAINDFEARVEREYER